MLMRLVFIAALHEGTSTTALTANEPVIQGSVLCRADAGTNPGKDN
jgi:hypothetical protein